MELFKDERWDTAENDSTELQIRYYAGLTASMIPDHRATIAIFEGLRGMGYLEDEVYMRLAYAYDQIEDNAAFENIIKEGFVKFPEDEFFVSSLINMSLRSENTEEALQYLEQAIRQYPDNAGFYNLMGQLYEIDRKQEEAIRYLKRSLELDPDNAEFLMHLGRVYFNLAVEQRSIADETADVNSSREAASRALDYFREAMPYFEKVYESDSQNTIAIGALRSIYYNLTMGEQFDRMDAIYSRLVGE
jgi:tetratricopeptide (TPR) repeat protein